MNKLVSRNLVQRFKEGRKIELFQNGGIKRFKVVGTDSSVKEFDTEQEAINYRKKLGKPAKIVDQKGASYDSTLKTNTTKGKDTRRTAYDRQEAEKLYNGLTFKQAYQKAQSSGNKYFAYKGKAYKTDLKNGKDNITEMEAMYGNNLGWDKDPKLQTKQSRTAREQYRKQIKSVDNSRPIKSLETNSSANEKADAYAKATWNGGKGFTDLIMPTNVGMKLGEKLVDKMFGTNYSNNNINAFGLNPFGWSEDLSEGNLKRALVRGVDAYTWLGMPGASTAVDKLFTNNAPRLLEVASTSKYIPEQGLLNGTLNKWNFNSLARGGNKAVKSSWNRGVQTVTEGGRRSMQRAANEGVNIGGFKGADKARQWATNFVQNPNTKTTFFFKGAPTSYDIVADRAVQTTPYLGIPFNFTNQVIDTHPLQK